MKTKELVPIEALGCYWDATMTDYGCGLTGDEALSAALSCAAYHGQKLGYITIYTYHDKDLKPYKNKIKVLGVWEDYTIIKR